VYPSTYRKPEWVYRTSPLVLDGAEAVSAVAVASAAVDSAVAVDTTAGAVAGSSSVAAVGEEAGASGVGEVASTIGVGSVGSAAGWDGSDAGSAADSDACWGGGVAVGGSTVRSLWQ
jgi:hypothetical protein